MSETSGKKPGYDYIKITNNAGYIARFTVIYTLHGKPSTHESGNFPIFTSRQIYVPREAILVILKVEEEAFIGKWKHFYYKLFPKSETKCYSLTGTVLNPKCIEIMCTDPFDNCQVESSCCKYTDYLLHGNKLETFPGYSYIQVTNNAGFVARFIVSYMLNGNLITRQSSEFTLLESDKIYIPNEAILIVVKIQEEVFIGKWVMFYLTSFLHPVTQCFSLTGTIFKPAATQIACIDS